MTRLVVVGDTLLDVDWAGSVTRVTPDAPVPVVEAPADDRRPGGAGLAAVVAASLFSPPKVVSWHGFRGRERGTEP
jgi:D-beta-D-heptose 7-phosphate kinase / D-beta-D-heptose 1-phosphate adenosyltransferase